MKPVESRESFSQEVLCVTSQEAWDYAVRGMVLNGFRGDENEIFDKTLHMGLELLYSLASYGCLNEQATVFVRNNQLIAASEIGGVISEAFTVFEEAEVGSDPLEYDQLGKAQIDQIAEVLSDNFDLELNGVPLNDLSVRTLARTVTVSIGFYLAAVVLSGSLKIGQGGNVEISFSPDNKTHENLAGKTSGAYSGLHLRDGELLSSSLSARLKRNLKKLF